MKTAGVVLDFYDDASGELLKRSFPTLEALPEVVKTAHILSDEEREVLRDEAYALVLVNEGKTLRKFACVDAGNTLLSALYFLEHKDSLPEEAQKVASANITAACEEFNLPLRDLEKIASGKKESPPTGSAKGAARSRDPMHQPLVGDEADWAARTNLVSIRGGADSGRVIPQASQMKTASFEDEHGIPNDKVEKKKKKHPKPTKEDKKPINFLEGFHRLNPEAAPKNEKTANMVDVSGLSAPLTVKKASAKHLALGRYPLDTYADVKQAVRYFSDNYLEMSPEDRHEYAVKTASRAQELKLKTSEILDRYGSTEYAPDVEAHLASRRAIAPEFKELWNGLQEKRASIEPEQFVQLLKEADEVASLNWEYGGEIADPYFATFGGNKVKEANAAWSWQGRTGEHVSGDQLRRLALNGNGIVAKQFDADFATEFSKNPITIFESMPDIHKKILARLASDEFDGLPNN